VAEAVVAVVVVRRGQRLAAQQVLPQAQAHWVQTREWPLSQAANG